MASLERTLRKDLEKTVKAARRVAEAGARIAIEQLGVGEAEAPRHLTADYRALRNRLRAHARQLGDRRDAPLDHAFDVAVVLLEVLWFEEHPLGPDDFAVPGHRLFGDGDGYFGLVHADRQRQLLAFRRDGHRGAPLRPRQIAEGCHHADIARIELQWPLDQP